MGSSDYTPSPGWDGHDFGSARHDYDRHVGRSYDDARKSKKVARDLIPAELETLSEGPLVVNIDQTGSMGKRTGIIVSKMPYLDHEMKRYLGPTAEICFMATGDASNSEDYPLQVRPFAKGPDMKKRAEELVIEGKGGGTKQESYELGALYGARKIKMPNAVHPVMIFVGDEAPYNTVSPDFAREYVGLELQHSLPTAEVFEELRRKFSVYVILAPYSNEVGLGDEMSSTTKRIYKAWELLVGEEHIAYLPEAERVVDVIFGILAKETGRLTYFRDEIEDRQRPEQVEAVYESLKSIHRVLPVEAGSPHSGRSIVRRPKDDAGTKSKKLL